MKNYLYASLTELKSLKRLVQCAVLVALYVVLSSFTIYITPSLKLTFAFIALASIAYLAGPVTAFFCGAACEVLAYVNPFVQQIGAFNPGIAFTTMLSGFVMGLFLYRRELKLWRVIAGRSFVAIILNLGLNTYWISVLLGKAYLILLPGRFLKAILLLPVEILLCHVMLKATYIVNNKDRMY